MKRYYIKSMIGEIAKGIDRLISKGVIQNDTGVILYGLDRYAFAMRTILSNKGYNNIDCYISDDEADVIKKKQEIENFRCRFLNLATGLIKAETINERLCPFDDKAVILVSSASYEAEKKKLEGFGYKEDEHFYKVYDFKDEELERLFEGKTLMNISEIKDVEKDILARIDEVCVKNGLRYWVCGGTLLGTIRHKGFIPWDDDIDIFLPWKDYLKFIELMEQDKRYVLLGLGREETADFSDIFAKVADNRTLICEDIGTVRKVNPLAVDVFPLIGLPYDDNERHMFFADYKELNRSIWQDFYAANGDIRIFGKWHKRQRSFLEKYDFDSSEYVGVLGTAYGERDCAGRAVYESTIRLPFEDIEVNVPTGYKEYLDNLYGKDWGILPDESKRKTHHNVLAYWM